MSTCVESKNIKDEFAKMVELCDNEEIQVDTDDNIASEFSMFQKAVKDITDFTKPENWFKAYRVLNYDIFSDLKITRAVKVNNEALIVELNFRGVVEYDILKYIPSNKTVLVYRAKNGAINKTVARRLLVPTNEEEALLYTTRNISKDEINSIAEMFKVVKEVKNKPEKVEKIVKVKEPEVVKEPEKKVEVVKEVKEPEKKVEVVKEVKEPEKKNNITSDRSTNKFLDAVKTGEYTVLDEKEKSKLVKDMCAEINSNVIKTIKANAVVTKPEEKIVEAKTNTTNKKERIVKPNIIVEKEQVLVQILKKLSYDEVEQINGKFKNFNDLVKLHLRIKKDVDKAVVEFMNNKQYAAAEFILANTLFAYKGSVAIQKIEISSYMNKIRL